MRVCPQCGKSYSNDDRFCTVDGAALRTADGAASVIGTVLAERYLVQERLGEGGMGEVYLAEHIRIKRKVAIKLMRRWMVGDPVAVSRFHREAENASQISHPNVAQVYDFGETSDGLIYLAMEFVPGEPLSAILEREGWLHAVRSAELVRQTADALVAAHGMGILHRDLKPDNIMVARTRTGTDLVKLVDFGIARVMNRGTQQFTSTGMIVGTPDYMSPEQLAGETLDERSDLYALALIAFRLLTGEGAFKGGPTGDALLARMMGRPRTLAEARPGVAWPAALQAAFDKALAATPAERYADALDFAAELDGAVAQLPLSEEEQAYLVLLSQRSATPSRGAMAVDTQTPVRSMNALGATPVTAQQAVGVATPPSESRAMPRPPTIERERDVESVPSATVDVPTADESATPTTPFLAASLDDDRRPPMAGRPRVADAPEPEALGSEATVTPTQPAAPAAPRRGGLLLGAAAIAAVAVAAIVWRGRDEAPAVPAPVADSAVTASESALPLDTSAVLATASEAGADSARVQRARAGVLSLTSSAGRGSALVLDSGGVLLTAASLVPSDGRVAVFVDADHTVRASVIQVDSAAGVAALRIAPATCRRCRPLAMGGSDTTRTAVAAGDTLLALVAARRVAVNAQPAVVARVSAGSFSTATTVGAAAIGAPVFNARTGQVVGLVTRRRGSLTVVNAASLRAAAAAARPRALAVATNDTLYRTWPLRPVPEGDLATAEGKSPDLAGYRVVVGAFDVLVMTPQVLAWRLAQSAAPPAEDNPFDIPTRTTPPPRDPLLEWRGVRDVRDERRAVVIVQVSPDRAAYPQVPDRTLDAKRADVLSFSITRDGVPLVPLESQRIPAVGNTDLYRRERKPIPSAGVYVFHPADFANSAASYQVEVVDANGGRRVGAPLPPVLVQAIGGDLAPWLR